MFFRDGDRVFRTYFINSRGDEAMGSTWSYLDAAPLGTPGDLGRLAGRLPADTALPAVELARPVLGPQEMGRDGGLRAER